jgi:hypothetical protein
MVAKTTQRKRRLKQISICASVGAVPEESIRTDATALRLRPSDPGFWIVINELPNSVPIANAELNALESYFADVLDAVFKPDGD